MLVEIHPYIPRLGPLSQNPSTPAIRLLRSWTWIAQQTPPAKHLQLPSTVTPEDHPGRRHRHMHRLRHKYDGRGKRMAPARMDRRSGAVFQAPVCPVERGSPRYESVAFLRCPILFLRQAALHLTLHLTALSNHTIHPSDELTLGCAPNSAMAPPRPALPAPPFTTPSASTIPTRTIVAKASTRRTLTTSRPVIPPCRPLSKPS